MICVTRVNWQSGTILGFYGMFTSVLKIIVVKGELVETKDAFKEDEYDNKRNKDTDQNVILH